MDGFSAFRPGGRTAMLLGSTLSPLPNVMMSTRPQGDITYLIGNAGANDAFVGYGMTSGAANANAAVPVAGAAVECLYVPAFSVQSFTLTPMLFFAAQTPQGNTQLFITPGDGV